MNKAWACAATISACAWTSQVSGASGGATNQCVGLIGGQGRARVGTLRAQPAPPSNRAPSFLDRSACGERCRDWGMR